MNHRKSFQRRQRKTRKRTRIYGGKSNKEIRKAASKRIANRLSKINRNEATQQAARIKAAQNAQTPDVETFSNYAEYHDTDAGVPQATGAALRDVTIHPTNPVFSF